VRALNSRREGIIPSMIHLRQALADVGRRVAWPKRALSAYATASSYLANNAIKKLHIGCGGNVLVGWLNSDYYPTSPGVIHLDATKRFSFPDETFHYVFSEHMIEHIMYPDGLRMLQQCHRVLKRNGRIRVSTPDLRFLIGLYSASKSELQTNYIRWSSESFIKNGEYTDTMVINNFVRAWGHVFIYDEKTLTRSLGLSGFVDVVACKINASQDEHLAGLENDQRMPAGFLQLETLTLEARKP
jgi:predicted SAM-dependent methyltransferase